MKKKEPEKIELNDKVVNDLEKQIQASSLSPETQNILIKLLKWAIWVNRLLELKSLSMKRFKRMLFGSKTEKNKKNNDKDNDGDHGTGSAPPKKPKKKKTNGKTPASKYSAHKEIDHQHDQLKIGDQCPECEIGKLYKYDPSIIVTFDGSQPITATKHNIQRLRCNACGLLFTPKIAEELRRKRYDESVATALALMRYGFGMPFKRLETLQKMLGVPISDSTQWKLIEEAASVAYPIYQSFKKFASNATILYNDDTDLKVLEYIKENEAKTGKDRTGAFTTAMIAIKDKIKVALFFSGRNHAGENLLKLIKDRDSSLDKIITMNDAASRAMPKDLIAEICNCFSHARRRFKELEDMKKSTREAKHVLKWIGKIYHNESKTKQLKMSDEERLCFHQKYSQKCVKRIYKWCTKMMREQKEEPNSGLGEAINYMLNHWPELTKFMSVPGAPLDNNICEQQIKTSIRHRKNSLFYKTEFGALIGDIFMSIIQTCKNVGANPFKYITTIQKWKKEVFKRPEQWLPWNFEQNLQS